MSKGRRIDILLVEDGYFASRAKAREAIEAGLVFADGKKVARPSEMMADGVVISARAPYPWVSRGGVKLNHALTHFNIDVGGRLCLDVGASTGGFTHVLLERGAAHVFAIDVGCGQLHPDIARDRRITAMESTDIRSLTTQSFITRPEIIVCDVSFISLKLVLPPALALAAPQAQMIALIKPQFEAGRERVGKGVVRDDGLRAQICEDVVAFVESLGWRARGVIPSPITGGDGNREYLLWAQQKA